MCQDPECSNGILAVELENAAERMRGTIADVIRWHYYCDRRWDLSRDPSYVGLPDELLLALQRTPDIDVTELKREGYAWAHCHLPSNFSPKWNEVPVEYLRNFVDQWRPSDA